MLAGQEKPYETCDLRKGAKSTNEVLFERVRTRLHKDRGAAPFAAQRLRHSESSVAQSNLKLVLEQRWWSTLPLGDLH